MTSVASLTSKTSSVSESSDCSVDGYSSCRASQEGSSGSVQYEFNHFSVNSLRDMSLPSYGNRLLPSNMIEQNSLDGSTSTTDGRAGKDAEFIQKGSNSHSYRDRENTRSNKVEMDLQFWLPPETDDHENDMECSVANYDDDDEDEGDDGTKWGRPSSLDSFGEKSCRSYRYKEEKQKAMDYVMNCKFKALVRHLLTSAGVGYLGKDGDNWVDIVTSLSWEAASFVKPDIGEGKTMGPYGYVKVKCVATGSRSESQLVKGMVFKKHAAHKHMPTYYKKPRLLLIQGALDLSLSGLSSFESMKQEKDTLKSVIERIEKCNPNRLSRCTRSLILSSDTLTGKKLRQCDSFHFEKLVEEHADTGESGKKPSKTLMFLSGCPSRQGCTILLKGTNSEELKKIKLVVQYAVLVAYHSILETAFLLDQKSMFSTLPLDGLVNMSPTDQQPYFCPSEANAPWPEDSIVESDSLGAIDIHIADGFYKEGSSGVGLESDSLLPYEPYNPLVSPRFSSISASLKKDINGEEKAPDNDRTSIHRKAQLDTQNSGGDYEDQTLFKDDINTMFYADSILVLMSRRNSSTGSICEQSHFSHIKFYRNFDVPLGTFLKDNLLNQRLLCSLCSGSPEAHIYYYAHHSRQLTIHVRRFTTQKHLPGEPDGKIWMWSCCGNCKPQNGKTQYTKRVLMSATAHGLSFGKFLELSLANRLSSSRISICGHQLHTDFLYFFGLGPMIAMLRYSPVTKYSVSLPPEKLNFSCQINGDCLNKYFESISKLNEEGIEVFLEAETHLKDISLHFEGSKLKIQGSLREFSDVVEMLKQERRQFEDDLKGTIKNWDLGDPVYKVVSLNRLKLDLLVASCVWDRRLHSLLSSEITTDTVIYDEQRQEQSNVEEDGNDGEEPDYAVQCEKVLDNGDDLDKYVVAVVKKTGVIEVPIEGDIQGSAEQYNLPIASTSRGDTQRFCMGMQSADGLYKQDLASSDISSDSHSVIDTLGDVTDSDLPRRKCSVLMVSSGQNSEWIWSPFLKIRYEYMKDLQKGYSLNFKPIHSYAQGSRIPGVINYEGSRLHIPLGTDNYIVSDHEDELSSVVACALALLRDPPPVLADPNEDSTREKGVDAKPYERSHSVFRPSSLTINYGSSFGSLTSDGVYSATGVASDDSVVFSTNGLYLSNSLIYFNDLHPKVYMGLSRSPGNGKYSVVSLYATEFRDLRRRCCSSEVDYIASLSRCRNWDAKGGKSKSFFAKTLDDHFIIKEIQRIEYESFCKFALEYFNYMNDCFEQGNQTCLAKILGIYQVTVRKKSGKETNHDLMVMENLTFGRSVSRQYDLKGALHARLNSAPNVSGAVLLDQNFVNDMNKSPFYVGRQAKRKLQRAVWNDTAFLNSINVMDYSLLVGVDTQKGELVCGIIDYLRQYTWDKQLETWVKSPLVPKNLLPTVISPKEYKKRFRKFITTHFVGVPDNWSQIC
ncbi:1-phosphatidylinositol-3-phosphate 5-kinase [Heracleum sosnowskyi]|uniref:1-phosphatidylinositol-3-phosphate 5-kinase n=1 Tax=Heracleum sosnowskyi TaxID=360622 RepID=A0AAD8N6P6_9APIA|nr:1-phosphatidylinositol-3-phosphate 5-kinase [Heracleum sosnowskyi]